ncbi:MAG: AraC family transcriptional regulator [Burkholderiaceae bacterium]
MPADSMHPAPRAVRYLETLTRAVEMIGEWLAAEDGMDDPLDGNLVADRVGMSRYHFHRIFRAYFGITIGRYITWRRLQKACELLNRADARVLDVALACGYESAQALAKAMRRELGMTPTAVRAGELPPDDAWRSLLDRPNVLTATPLALRPTLVYLPALPILCATESGRTSRDMSDVAERAFAALLPRLDQHSHRDRVDAFIGIFPDVPAEWSDLPLDWPDPVPDSEIRFHAGALFGFDLARRSGRPIRVDIPLDARLAWLDLPAGMHAVFTHIGPHDRLHELWNAIYRDWLAATGYALGTTLPFEHYVTRPPGTAPASCRTDLYLPLA